jgi:hypothetical protein
LTGDKFSRNIFPMQSKAFFQEQKSIVLSKNITNLSFFSRHCGLDPQYPEQSGDAETSSA